jgi:hypothetical protein
VKQGISAATLNAQSKLTLTQARLGASQSGGGTLIKALNEHRRTEPKPRQPCYRYVTRTVKATRPLADGTWERYSYTETVRVPFTPPRAESVRTVKPRSERQTQALHRSECAALPMAQDLNEM